jgi:hypothetical protein
MRRAAALWTDMSAAARNDDDKQKFAEVAFRLAQRAELLENALHREAGTPASPKLA